MHASKPDGRSIPQPAKAPKHLANGMVALEGRWQLLLAIHELEIPAQKRESIGQAATCLALPNPGHAPVCEAGICRTRHHHTVLVW